MMFDEQREGHGFIHQAGGLFFLRLPFRLQRRVHQANWKLYDCSYLSLHCIWPCDELAP